MGPINTKTKLVPYNHQSNMKLNKKWKFPMISITRNNPNKNKQMSIKTNSDIKRKPSNINSSSNFSIKDRTVLTDINGTNSAGSTLNLKQIYTIKLTNTNTKHKTNNLIMNKNRTIKRIITDFSINHSLFIYRVLNFLISR